MRRGSLPIREMFYLTTEYRAASRVIKPPYNRLSFERINHWRGGSGDPPAMFNPGTTDSAIYPRANLLHGLAFEITKCAA